MRTVTGFLCRSHAVFRHNCNPATGLASCYAFHQATGGMVSFSSSRHLNSAALTPWTGYGAGIEQAVTLPASWYTDAVALQLEKQHVFYNSWQMVCSASQLQHAGDYLCGSLADVRYIINRGQDGQLRAFHNVCRHHAAAVAHGCGNSLHFTCPYHNWTYDDKGRLVKATRLKGIKDFKASQYGLHPIALGVWGDLVFLHLQGGKPPAGDATQAQQALPKVSEWLGAGGSRLQELGMCDDNLVHITRREYVLNCNWKVFCDNYLDGGYHVPYAHKDLAAGLDLSGYRSELHDTLSIQISPVSCQTAAADNVSIETEQPGRTPHNDSNSSSGDGSSGAVQLDRLTGGSARDAGYAFVYPNLMINRYGPWMDTNVVVPLNGSSVDRCRVIFDYWLEADALQQAAATVDPTTYGSSISISSRNAGILKAALQSDFVQDSLASSHKVQEEDIALCEAVQLGLQEPAYGVGRYAPGPEAPMYHFHTLYYSNMMQANQEQLS